MQYVSPNLKFVSEPIFLETSPDGESLLFNVYSALIFKLLSNLVPGCLVILSILYCVCSMNGIRIVGYCRCVIVIRLLPGCYCFRSLTTCECTQWSGVEQQYLNSLGLNSPRSGIAERWLCFQWLGTLPHPELLRQFSELLSLRQLRPLTQRSVSSSPLLW